MKRWFFLIGVFVTCISKLSAGYTIYDGKFVNTDDVPDFSSGKHYELAIEAMNARDWKEAVYHFNIITKNFSREAFYPESQYYLAVSYFFLQEYDFANLSFSAYLSCQSNPVFFEDAIAYKLQIANCFKNGAKRRFFGTKMLPKWAPARALALEIYNEVILALPCHEYAAQALYEKGYLLWEDREFRESVDAFQTLIRRFPKHILAPASYACIGYVYLDQAKCEFQNPDILVLAEINLRKFEKDFPKDERLEEASCNVLAIKEQYAQGLFETGQFYERIEKPLASILYYKSAIHQFPDTSYAKCSRRRLEILSREIGEEMCEPSS